MADQVLRLPAALEWALDDGTQYRLIDSTTRPLTFSAISGTSGETILLELQLTVELRQIETSRAKTPFYLWIELDRIRSAILGSDSIPEQVSNNLGSGTKSLHLILGRPADLVGPPFVPRATKNAEGTILDYILLLPNSRSLTIYLKSGKPFVQFYQSLSNQKLQSQDITARLPALYNGRGGRVLTGLLPAHPGPPSYEKELLDVSSQSTAVPTSSKRRRISSPGSTETTRLEAICTKMISEQQRSFTDTLRRELAGLEARISEHVNGLFKEQSEQWNDLLTSEVNELGERIERAEDELDYHLDDRMVGVKVELEDWVKDEIKNAADDIKDQITQASISIEFDE